MTKYRSGVGSINNLVKHTRPDIANAVQELAKVMDGAQKLHVKMMQRVIKFVLDTKDKELKLKPVARPNGKWGIQLSVVLDKIKIQEEV